MFTNLTHGGVEAVLEVAIGFAAILIFPQLTRIELGDFSLLDFCFIHIVVGVRRCGGGGGSSR